MSDNACPVGSAESGTAAARSIDDLEADIRRITSRIDAATYELLLAVREFDDRLGWAKWGFACCSEWLAWQCGLSLSTAREKLRTAHALRSLPRISTSFKEGRVSYSKVRSLTRVAEWQNEDELLEFAFEATAQQVEERCRQIRNARPDSIHDAKRAWQRRALCVSRNPEHGTLTITIELPVETGELVLRALDRAVGAGEAAVGPEFEGASWQAQQADALVAIAKAYSAGAAGEGGSVAEPYQVVVHVDQAALHGGAGRSDLPIDTVKRLICDGQLFAVSGDGHGTPLNVGRKQRTVPTAIRRALWARDKHCAFPGCRRSRFVQAHHIEHWSEGGETSVENLTLLCSHHHTLVHEGGYTIQRDQDGKIYFQRADGRVIPRCGYRVDDVRPDPILLEDDDPSAEGWLAGVVRRRRPATQVREPPGSYCPGSRFRRRFPPSLRV